MEDTWLNRITFPVDSDGNAINQIIDFNAQFYGLIIKWRMIFIVGQAPCTFYGNIIKLHVYIKKIFYKVIVMRLKHNWRPFLNLQLWWDFNIIVIVFQWCEGMHY